MTSILPCYQSSDDDADDGDNDENYIVTDEKANKAQDSDNLLDKYQTTAQIGSNLVPDIDVNQLIEQKKTKDLQKFYTQNKVITKKNHMNGYVQSSFIDQATFDQQFNQFRNKGYSYDPSISINSLSQTDLLDPNKMVFSSTIQFNPNRTAEKLTASQRKKLRKELKSKRKQQGQANSNTFLGPWAGYVDDQKEEDLPSEQMAELTEQQKVRMKQFQEKRQIRTKELQQQQDRVRKQRQLANPQITSIFHGSELRDYQGKSFVAPPSYLKHDVSKRINCYIPKKWIHNFTGHSKSVQCVRFIKPYGHLLLSGSHDQKIKLWDVLTNKRCIMTYIGHQMAIKDLCFNSNGTRFLSAGYDRLIQLWDTQKGKVIHTFSNRKIPFCVKFHPDNDKQNLFLAGLQNRKIIQWDTNSGQIVQHYDQHMGSVNTINFIEGNKRFVSTSDDKKIFVWEFGIPVVVKQISDPQMFAINQAEIHPNQKYFVGQSIDNKIVVYDVKGSFKINKKKQFVGHKTSGYSCGLSFSPDGQFLCSGDSQGKIWFWDWKTCKNYRSIRAHNQVCIDVKWHPTQSSKVVTCGWDSNICQWD